MEGNVIRDMRPIYLTQGPSLFPLNHVFPTWSVAWAGVSLVEAVTHFCPEVSVTVDCPDALKGWCGDRFPSVTMGNTPPTDAWVLSGATCPTLTLMEGIRTGQVGRLYGEIHHAHDALDQWGGALPLLTSLALEQGAMDPSQKGQSGWDHVAVVGHEAVLIHPTAVIDPWVCIDARHGPVMVGPHAHVQSHVRLVGPVVVGPHSTVLHGQLAQSCVGEWCKVGGEVSHSIWVGWSNKAHEGFMGHSVVGQWVNIGAGTITSNLKHTYGPIQTGPAHDRLTTGKTFLGAMIGDFVKMGIGTCLPTGAVVGTGAVVMGTGVQASFIPPFSWGNAGDTVTLAGFETSVTRMMARRHQVLHAGVLQRVAEQMGGAS